jgi:hypothetical protein
MRGIRLVCDRMWVIGIRSMNQDNPSGQANVSPPFDFNLFLKKILALGWGLLVLSIVFLYLSSGVIGGEGLS